MQTCFRELYDKQPNVETALLLGDAYMSIQEVCLNSISTADQTF